MNNQDAPPYTTEEINRMKGELPKLIQPERSFIRFLATIDDLTRRLEEVRPQGRSFEQVWQQKEQEGYQYGHDALEQVRFGWELREAEGVPALDSLRGLLRSEEEKASVHFKLLIEVQVRLEKLIRVARRCGYAAKYCGVCRDHLDKCDKDMRNPCAGAEMRSLLREFDAG